MPAFQDLFISAEEVAEFDWTVLLIAGETNLQIDSFICYTTNMYHMIRCTNMLLLYYRTGRLHTLHLCTPCTYLVIVMYQIFSLDIVIRGDWLGKAANINDKNNSAAVCVGSTLKVHNPLFSVGKLLRNKLMQRFYWSIQSK